MPILQNRNISNKLPNFIQQRTRKRKQMSEQKEIKEARKIIEKIDETKNWFFEMINKTDECF